MKYLMVILIRQFKFGMNLLRSMVILTPTNSTIHSILKYIAELLLWKYLISILKK